MPLYFDGKKHLPAPSGPYVVSHADLMTGPNAEEGTFMRLFFPTELENIYEHSSVWTPWIPHPKYLEGFVLVSGLFPLLGRLVLSWMFGNSFVPIVMDATPLNKTKFPVVIFSHGLKSCRIAYSAVCSELSSHGFIVVALEHRDGSACMTYHLKKEVEQEELIEDWMPFEEMEYEDMTYRQNQLEIRIQECRRALDLLHLLNDGKQIDNVLLTTNDLIQFKGILDLTNPVLAGHSFGAATTLRTLAEDKRFKVGVAFDAWMWPLHKEKDLPNEIDQPLLFINMEHFQTAKNLKTMKQFAESDVAERRVVTIRGSVHQNQADTPFLVPYYFRGLAGVDSTIDAELAMNLNNRLTLTHLLKHLGYSSNEDHSKYLESYNEWIYEGIKVESETETETETGTETETDSIKE